MIASGDLATRLGVLAVLVGLAALGWLAVQLRRRALLGQARGDVSGDHPTLLYFSTPQCAQCRAQQWPAIERALASFTDVFVQKIDALAEPQLADRWGVLTVPTTILVDRTGQVRAVNYGLASASKLAGQLAQVASGE